MLEISKMAVALGKQKARARIHRIEEIHLDKMKDKVKNKLIEIVMEQIDENYGKASQISEEALKKQLGGLLPS